MNIGGIFVAIVVGLFVVVGVRQSTLLWVGSARFRYRDSMPPGMPMSPELWKHYVRAIPMLTVATVFFAAAGLVAAVANGPGTIVLALCSVLALGVAPLVVLFNRPKALVPPACRNEPGWIEQRRGD